MSTDILGRKRLLEEVLDEESTAGFHSVRSGKWSPEEESYANQLVADFEKGILIDCEDGCTLRSYLARRLNCAPMRISKKFAGRCIGKMAFAKKPVEQDVLEASLLQLEDLYIKSCRSVVTEVKRTVSNNGGNSANYLSANSRQKYQNISEGTTSDMEESDILKSFMINTCCGFDEPGVSDEEGTLTGSLSDNSTSSASSDRDPVPVGLHAEDISIEHFNGFEYCLPTIENFTSSSEMFVDPKEWQDVLSYFSEDTGEGFTSCTGSSEDLDSKERGLSIEGGETEGGADGEGEDSWLEESALWRSTFTRSASYGSATTEIEDFSELV